MEFVLLRQRILALPGRVYVFEPCMPNYAAEVSASNNLVGSLFGAAFPLFTNSVYSRLGITWRSSSLGLLSIAFILIPFDLYYDGERIRHKSTTVKHCP